MKRKSFSTGSIRKPFAYWRNEKGITGVEIAVTITLTLLIIGVLVNALPDQKASLKGLQNSLKESEALLREQFDNIDDIKKITAPLGDNGNAQNILRIAKEIEKKLDEKKQGDTPEAKEIKQLREAMAALVECKLTLLPQSGAAGQARDISVTARIPFFRPAGTGPGTSSAVISSQICKSDGINPSGPLTWQATLNCRAKDSKSLFDNLPKDQNTTSTFVRVQVESRASVPPKDKFDKDQSCNPEALFDWIRPQPPAATLEADKKSITKGVGDKVTLTYKVVDAESADLDGEDIILNNGAAEGTKDVFPDKDTTYTLTAKGFGDPVSPKVEIKVTERGAVTLNPIQNPVTDIHQKVTGKGPVPNRGQRARGLETASAGENGTVDIRVNGALQATVPIGDDGGFAADVVLSKVVTQADLSVSDFSNAVASCGPASTGVVVTNSATDVENVITATVTPPPGIIASALERTADAASASITVRHAVKLTNFNVNWGGCPGGSPDQPVNTVLEAGQSLPVGTVDCGVFSRDDPVFSIGSCFPIVTIGTSLSSLQSTQVWDFATPSPDDPICPEKMGDGDGDG